ncbi:BZ3500_MvSof-1268-A1-R1_Chr8-1g09785 [Microbotryum saponariae]|uniref:BZ3500_MvSof-1268-A1-R1_Chr8-1g09785 protein n=1 Tax=Microbotryum saponariae TaxID=289078 RepID=A0A2X0KTV8_9BASI|nr:BZ3500_MvSof-1268-A1-R1_Chr8-1g09785 [Microbotryum saponariae]SDA08071.1 BZ3501_MvSof-1269-A2-R1_Chr8-1g09508 [Microbotryum saponariae]
MDSNVVPPVPGTANSIISSWRTKASDKEAIAAGVAQAKDAMKRWGANWSARRKIDEDVSSPPQDDGQSLPSSTSDPTLGKVADGSYRDYRASKSTAARGGEYFHPVSTAGSAPVAIVGDGSISVENGDGGRAKKNSLTSSPSKTHFTPAASSPTTKISAVATLAAGSPTEPIPRPLPTTTHKSPTSPPNAPARVYKPATMMAIPGIRDDAKRKAIAADHMAAPAPAPEAAAAVVPPPSTSPNTAAVIGASETSSDAVPFGPPPSISDRSEKPGTTELEPLTATSTAARPTTSPPPLAADVTTPEMETKLIDKPKPPIPARPHTTEATSNEEESAPDPGTDDGSTQESGGLLPAAPIEATSTPSITASRPAWIRNDKPNSEPASHAQINTSSEAVAEDETADEAGWGLESGRAQS